ncbi:MAG: hypothetical protein PHD30_00665 [Paludibacter sp.]|nr:hypothetical protein [Paludibacter sp.]
MSFFKLHKPLVYKYKPIYYDPKKEAQKERMKNLEKDKQTEENGGYEPKVLHRGAFREMADKNRNSRNAQTRQSNIRLIIIILILFLIAYFLLR